MATSYSHRIRADKKARKQQQKELNRRVELKLRAELRTEAESLSFWVEQGTDLALRPVPRELPARRPPQSKGRWVARPDLCAGDVIVGLDGTRGVAREVPKDLALPIQVQPLSELAAIPLTPTGPIRATRNHPWYVKDRGWVATEDLRSGDLLRTSDGRWVTVARVDDRSEKELVYNLQVRGAHTYFVGLPGSDHALLVHNQSPKQIKGKSEGGEEGVVVTPSKAAKDGRPRAIEGTDVYINHKDAGFNLRNKREFYKLLKNLTAEQFADFLEFLKLDKDKDTVNRLMALHAAWKKNSNIDVEGGFAVIFTALETQRKSGRIIGILNPGVNNPRAVMYATIEVVGDKLRITLRAGSYRRRPFVGIVSGVELGSQEPDRDSAQAAVQWKSGGKPIGETVHNAIDDPRRAAQWEFVDEYNTKNLKQVEHYGRATVDFKIPKDATEFDAVIFYTDEIWEKVNMAGVMASWQGELKDGQLKVEVVPDDVTIQHNEGEYTVLSRDGIQADTEKVAKKLRLELTERRRDRNFEADDSQFHLNGGRPIEKGDPPLGKLPKPAAPKSTTPKSIFDL